MLRKKAIGFAVIFAFSFFLLNGARAADTSSHLIIPRDLFIVAQARNCNQFSDFYSMANRYPAHVYGVLPGNPLASATFWCWREPSEAVLMFMIVEDGKNKYAGEIVFPRRLLSGLAVNKSFIEPKIPESVEVIPDIYGQHPQGRKFNGVAINIGIEELTTIFYKGGKWYRSFNEW